MSGMTAKARIKLTNALQVLLGPPRPRGGGVNKSKSEV